MKDVTRGPLAEAIDRYIAHKRSLGKQLVKTEPMLHMLDGYLPRRGITDADQITPSSLQEFVMSRPRHTPRSYNQLLGMIRRLFNWMVAHEVLYESPFRCKQRRAVATRRPFIFNPEQARNLLDAALQLPDNSRAQDRGNAYRLIFAILYGLGLRVGEVSRLCRQDVDLDSANTQPEWRILTQPASRYWSASNERLMPVPLNWLYRPCPATIFSVDFGGSFALTFHAC